MSNPRLNDSVLIRALEPLKRSLCSSSHVLGIGLGARLEDRDPQDVGYAIKVYVDTHEDHEQLIESRAIPESVSLRIEPDLEIRLPIQVEEIGQARIDVGGDVSGAPATLEGS